MKNVLVLPLVVLFSAVTSLVVAQGGSNTNRNSPEWVKSSSSSHVQVGPRTLLGAKPASISISERAKPPVSVLPTRRDSLLSLRTQYLPTNPRVQIVVDGEIIAERFASERTKEPTEVVFPSYGTEYEIHLFNTPMQSEFVATLDQRLLAIEIDGLSVMNGKPSSGHPTGYVLGYRQEAAIKGWRVDNETVDRFVVSRPEDSLASRESMLEHTGTICVRVYSPKQHSVRLHQRPLTTIPSLGLSRPNAYGGTKQSNSARIESSLHGAAGTSSGVQIASRANSVFFDFDDQSEKKIEFTYRVAEETHRDKVSQNGPQLDQ
jgi:hypothetical protein